jgi:hypothetical protein
MTWGAQKAERIRFEHRYPVNLMGVDGTWRRTCILLDVSTTGARLEVDGTLDVLKAQEFFLLLSSTGLAFRRCNSSVLTDLRSAFASSRRRRRRRDAPSSQHNGLSIRASDKLGSVTMQLIFSRIIPFIDVQTLASGEVRESLFRDAGNGFILYQSDSIASSVANERVIRLEMREALIWLNETSHAETSPWN